MPIHSQVALTNSSPFFIFSGIPVIGRCRHCGSHLHHSIPSLTCGLVALALLFSGFRTKSARFEDIDIEGVTSALVSRQVGPYRAPLRRVVLRKPIGFFRHPDRQDLGEYNIGVYIRETLECGHKLDVIPHDAEPLIARYRRCRKCLAEALPPKKPVRSVRPSPDESEVA